MVACNASTVAPPFGCGKLEKLPPSNTLTNSVVLSSTAAETSESPGVSQSMSTFHNFTWSVSIPDHASSCIYITVAPPVVGQLSLLMFNTWGLWKPLVTNPGNENDNIWGSVPSDAASIIASLWNTCNLLALPVFSVI